MAAHVTALGIVLSLSRLTTGQTAPDPDHSDLYSDYDMDVTTPFYEDAITGIDMATKFPSVKLPVSSWSHICHAQCLAKCTDAERKDVPSALPSELQSRDDVSKQQNISSDTTIKRWGISSECEDKCKHYENDSWAIACRSDEESDSVGSDAYECLSNCHDLHNDTVSENAAPPDKPTDITLAQMDPYTIHLNWSHKRKSIHYVVYVIEGREMSESAQHRWHVLQQTYKTETNLTVDICKALEFRIASVNQFGTHGFTHQDAEREDLPVPGPITAFMEFKPPRVITDDLGSLFFIYSYKFSPPAEWNSEDIRTYDIADFTTIYCPLNTLAPVPNYSFDPVGDGSGDYIWTITAHELGYGCDYFYSLIAINRCAVKGEPYNYTLSITDCSVIQNYACPTTPEPWVVYPEEVENVNVSVDHNTMEVKVTWTEPKELGSFSTIEYYLVQWGLLSYFTFHGMQFQDPALEEEGRINETATNSTDYAVVFTVKNREILYGVKIYPVVPGQDNLTELNSDLDKMRSSATFAVDGQDDKGLENTTRSFHTALTTLLSDSDSSSGKFLSGEGSDDNSETLLLYILAPTAAVVIMSVALIAVTLYRRNRAKKKPEIETGGFQFNDLNIDKQVTSMMVPNPFYDKNGSALPVVADRWEVDRNFLSLGDSLGKGAFGQVLKGSLKTEGIRNLRKISNSSLASSLEESNPEEITVAVKLLLDYADDSHRQDFLKEIDLMKSIGYHPNVVSMIGCCTRTAPLALIVEHLPNGDLLHYLRKHRHYIQESGDSGITEERLTLLDLLSIARQIAVGMEFLSQKGFVHRDLACRNILVGDNKTVKIGDFGLTRYIYDDKVYVTRKGGKLPLKWMAVEAIFDLTFTSASDVWSFGVVMFELVTLGGTPYPTIANRDLLQALNKGYRMERPDNCTESLYNMMTDCWKSAPTERPTFTRLRDILDVMIESYSSVEYMTFDLDHTKDYYRLSHSEGSTNDEEESVFGRIRNTSLSLRKNTSGTIASSPESGLGTESEAKWPALKTTRPAQRKTKTTLGLTPLRVLHRSQDDMFVTSSCSMDQLISRSSLSTSDPGYETQKSWMALSTGVTGETKL